MDRPPSGAILSHLTFRSFRKTKMAVSSVSSSVAGLSKAEYLIRYLSADEDGKKAKGKIKKKRPKVVKKG